MDGLSQRGFTEGKLAYALAEKGTYRVVCQISDGRISTLQHWIVEVVEGGRSRDFNRDGVVDLSDFFLLLDAFGGRSDSDLFDPAFDLDRTGLIDLSDLLLFLDRVGDQPAEFR